MRRKHGKGWSFEGASKKLTKAFCNTEHLIRNLKYKKSLVDTVKNDVIRLKEVFIVDC